MKHILTFGERVLAFQRKLAEITIDLPAGFKLINPYNGEDKKLIQHVTTIFYQKFFADNIPRRLILGSSPARRGTAVTGIPFEDADHLYSETGIKIDNFYINRSSSDFLYEVMNKYGGSKTFYQDFYTSFVCPLGLIRINEKGRAVNCNYYENKKILNQLEIFIVNSLRTQISLGIDTSVCFCIGSSQNFQTLTKINNKYNFFNVIVPLEHPRFITQYNYQKRDFYLKKYLTVLKKKSY